MLTSNSDARFSVSARFIRLGQIRSQLECVVLHKVFRSIKSTCICLGAMLVVPFSSQAAPATADTILRWLPPGTVEIRCINGPVHCAKDDSAEPSDSRSGSLLEFMQGSAGGNISQFLADSSSPTRSAICGKTISTSVRGSQVLELTAADMKSYLAVDPKMKIDCWPDVDIVEFKEPIKKELSADLLSRPLKHYMLGANQVWEAQSPTFPRNLHLYLAIPDDHTVMISSATSPALLLAALQRMKVRATSCVIPVNHVGWRYIDRQSDYWFFNAYPAANKNLSSSAEPRGLDDFAKSGLAVVAQYRPAKTAAFQFVYVSNSSNALALLKERLDINLITSRMRFTPRTSKIIAFDYLPNKGIELDLTLVNAALCSMVGHEVD